jgi:hypothetical protein
VGQLPQTLAARDDFDDSPSSAAKDRVDRLSLTADALLGTAVLTLATTTLLHAVLGPRARSRASVQIQAQRRRERGVIRVAVYLQAFVVDCLSCSYTMYEYLLYNRN